MRRAVVVCGANGERGVILEKVVDRFARENESKIIQFTCGGIAVGPLMLNMSSVDLDRVITVNGCRNQCATRIVERTGARVETSCVLDDALQRDVEACRTTCSFEFPFMNDEEVRRFVAIITKALD
jgi:uncharacterized metal-binding protein